MFAIETVKFRAAQQIYCVKHQMKIPFEIGNFVYDLLEQDWLWNFQKNLLKIAGKQSKNLKHQGTVKS